MGDSISSHELLYDLTAPLEDVEAEILKMCGMDRHMSAVVMTDKTQKAAAKGIKDDNNIVGAETWIVFALPSPPRR